MGSLSIQRREVYDLSYARLHFEKRMAWIRDNFMYIEIRKRIVNIGCVLSRLRGRCGKEIVFLFDIYSFRIRAICRVGSMKGHASGIDERK